MFVCMSSQRTNMSVAIVCMVNHTAVGDLNRSDVTPPTVAECGHNVTHGQDDDGMQDGEHLWDKRTQGLILSSFFWGYLCTQIPGGLLAKKYGPGWTYAGFQFTASVLTMLCRWATMVGWRRMLAMRFLSCSNSNSN
ncbi:PREDICTED: putative inorganic phosphate cotransporter isoform X2 [Priapulus caudatus]|uniref:Inorganic phosphate cotransporter isoform X2 n=1 Tax=Priapulus caudatus TaxID=37621 RepID=A0ABM1ESG6_PRICU|nr:PREDICTED: putative inorganic phosphate cotransporter isoform X2 [Priapulus caudatus]